MRVFDFDFFFLGTATVVSLCERQNFPLKGPYEDSRGPTDSHPSPDWGSTPRVGLAQSVERSPAGVTHGRGAAAGSVGEIGPALTAEPGAIVSTQRTEWQGQENVLSDHRQEVDLVSVDRVGIGVFDRALVELVDLDIESAAHRHETPAALTVPGRRDVSGGGDPVAQRLEPDRNIDRFVDDARIVEGNVVARDRHVDLFDRAGYPEEFDDVDDEGRPHRALPAVLVEECAAVTRTLVVVGDRFVVAHAYRQSLSSGCDGARQAIEKNLETPETLVEEVLGLVAQSTGLFVGSIDDLPCACLCGPHDLGALHHSLGLLPCRTEQFVGFSLGLFEELLSLLEHPACLPDLFGQSGNCFFEQFDDLVAVDSRRRRERHARSGRDDVERASQQHLGLAEPGLHRGRLRIRIVGGVVEVIPGHDVGPLLIPDYFCCPRAINGTTAAGTIDVMSPPCRAMSRMNRLLT